MGSKPALLSGGDSEHLGLASVKSDQVHSITSKITCMNRPNNPADSSGYQRTEHNPLETLCLTREAILTKYEDTFKGIGCLGPTVCFKLKEDTHPVQMPIHRVPVTKCGKEKQAIDNYVKAGILKKVQDPTPWCSNELIRETPKKFRVCIDPSQTINKVIERPVYQMPTLPEHLHKLSKAKCFSLAYVREGFLHLPLDDESSYLTTMHTSYGRYRWTRLPFGIGSAPEEFQMRLKTALEGLDGTFCIADDILVYGEGETYAEAEKNHDQRFTAFMDRCREKTIKLNPDKLQFKLREIKFMGNIVTDTGIRTDPDKVKAITEMEPPANKSALLRFIGMANYLSPYCKNLSSTIQPLRMLTHDGVSYSWSDEQQSAFAKAKTLIANAPTLMYYDVCKPVVLQVDASDQGLGGTLLQPNENRTLQPVAYTSCSLNSTEQMYSQIEKECLAICNCFNKFDHWLYGKSNIEVHTDNLPLVTVLKKPLNKATARLQRMMMKLQRYIFKVLHKRGTSLYLADTLSRAALSQPVSVKVTGFDTFRVELQHTFTDRNVRLTEPTETKIREETQRDKVMSALCKTIIYGWPDQKSQLSEYLQPYWSYREELSVNNNIIYKGMQVFVPQSMHSDMLKKIHANHLGAESNVRMAREVLFWPGMRKAIHDMCNACQTCAQYGTSASTEPMKSLPIPSGPWQLVSQDIFTFQSEHYLITVCHFSDWIEVDKLEDLSTSAVVESTKAHFSRYSVPAICHTDNGPQFTSAEYENFAKAYSFQHTTSSPYHPEGNGRAEAAVKLIEMMMKKSDDLHIAMLHYRNTPPKGHTYSPAQRMLLRRARTTLPTSMEAIAPQLISYETVMPRKPSANPISCCMTKKYKRNTPSCQLAAGPMLNHLPTEGVIAGAMGSSPMWTESGHIHSIPHQVPYVEIGYIYDHLQLNLSQWQITQFCHLLCQYCHVLLLRRVTPHWTQIHRTVRTLQRSHLQSHPILQIVTTSRHQENRINLFGNQLVIDDYLSNFKTMISFRSDKMTITFIVLSNIAFIHFFWHRYPRSLVLVLVHCSCFLHKGRCWYS